MWSLRSPRWPCMALSPRKSIVGTEAPRPSMALHGLTWDCHLSKPVLRPRATLRSRLSSASLGAILILGGTFHPTSPSGSLSMCPRKPIVEGYRHSPRKSGSKGCWSRSSFRSRKMAGWVSRSSRARSSIPSSRSGSLLPRSLPYNESSNVSITCGGTTACPARSRGCSTEPSGTNPVSPAKTRPNQRSFPSNAPISGVSTAKCAVGSSKMKP